MHDDDGVRFLLTDHPSTGLYRIVGRTGVPDVYNECRQRKAVSNGKVNRLRAGPLWTGLGSVNVVLNVDGGVRSRLRYDPWGQVRWYQNVAPTGSRYTAQRWDGGLGLYDYHARYYDPHIGRFISADVIVPDTSRLTPLTVGFHETMFLEQANGESRQLAQFGPVFTWGQKLKQQFGAPAGTAAPQLLNRFAYVANNPLGYTDPTGHQLVNNFDVELSPEQVDDLIEHLGAWIDLPGPIEDLSPAVWTVDAILVLLPMLGEAGLSLLVRLIALKVPHIALTASAFAIFATFTRNDLRDLRVALIRASDNSRQLYE